MCPGGCPAPWRTSSLGVYLVTLALSMRYLLLSFLSPRWTVQVIRHALTDRREAGTFLSSGGKGLLSVWFSLPLTPSPLHPKMLLEFHFCSKILLVSAIPRSHAFCRALRIQTLYVSFWCLPQLSLWPGHLPKCPSLCLVCACLGWEHSEHLSPW